MPIEGNNEESQEESKSESEVDSLFDSPTESLEFVDDPDDFLLFTAKGLCNIASHMDWSVSVRKIIYRGVKDFEITLSKQFQRHMEVSLYDSLCANLKLKSRSLQPPYRKEQVRRRHKKMKTLAFSKEEAFLSFFESIGFFIPQLTPRSLSFHLIHTSLFSCL